MVNVVARVNPNPNQLGKVSPSKQVQAKTVAVGNPVKLTDLSDVDSSQLENGAVMVYDGSTQTFVLKPEMDNPGTKIIGGKY